MDSEREQQRIWPAAGVLAISVLVHVALLFVPLPGPRHETNEIAPSTLRVELIAQPSPTPTPTPEEAPAAPKPPEPKARKSAQPHQPTPPGQATPEAAASGEPTSEPASPWPAVAVPDPGPETIRARLLGAARKLGRESEKTGEARGVNYRDVPELPSQQGWLHQYTGRASTSIDRWRGNDGSTSARIVTGSGQIVCVHTRAPTTAEIFNPWMSAAVPMMSVCGRERPEGVDRADPWVRAPGGGTGLGENP